MTARQSRVYRAIVKARRYGLVRVAFAKPVGTGAAALDRFAEACGFHPVGEDWIELDRGTAERRLAHILGTGMAYGNPAMDAGRAGELARQFVANFAADGRFFSNMEEWCVTPSGGRSRGGTPLTDATIDEGVAGIDSTQVGIVVVMDED